MTPDQQTRAVLLAQRDRCPALRPEDLLKTLHQSVFGCGHFVSGGGLARIEAELSALPPRPDEPETEPLDGPFCRLNLSCVPKLGLEPGTVSWLFARSARQTAGRAEELEPKLACFLALAEAGAFPFGPEEARRAAETWRASGFPACRHSEIYRAACAPAYRVIRREYAPLLPLLAGIDRTLRKRPRVIAAIEGGSASGKTTLAALLEEGYGCAVFHLDDFFLRPCQRTPERYAQPGGNVDWERFLQEVLLPLSRGAAAAYRPYDCKTQTLGPVQTAPPKALNLVEGVYSMRPELAAHYDLSVFLEISPQLQRRRILSRNGPEMGEMFFERWIPLERQYFAAMDPRSRCDYRLEAER